MANEITEVSCLACGGYESRCERCHGTGEVPVSRLTPEEHRRHFDGPTDSELGGYLGLTLSEVP